MHQTLIPQEKLAAILLHPSMMGAHLRITGDVEPSSGYIDRISQDGTQVVIIYNGEDEEVALNLLDTEGLSVGHRLEFRTHVLMLSIIRN